MKRIQKIAYIVGGAILAIALAYVLGVEAGDYINKKKRAEVGAKGIETSAIILEHMGTIAVGDTLANFVLEDIAGNVVMLSEIITRLSMISYIKPDCEGCLVHIDAIRGAISDSADYRHFILISSANPVHMQELRSNFGVDCPMLFDEERMLGASLRIQTFPFSLVVDRSREIREIYTGSMLQEVYEQIIVANS